MSRTPLTSARGFVALVAPARIVWLLAWCLLALAACTVQLAPDYDKTIVDGLTAANQDTTTLFAGLSAGVSASTFPDREKTYNSIIGKFDALRLEAKARPVPQPLLSHLFGSTAVGEKPLPADQILKSPTPDVLQNIVDTITTMRDEDKKQGLVAKRAESFKSEYELSIQQALVYEKALLR